MRNKYSTPIAASVEGKRGDKPKEKKRTRSAIGINNQAGPHDLLLQMHCTAIELALVAVWALNEFGHYYLSSVK